MDSFSQDWQPPEQPKDNRSGARRAQAMPLVNQVVPAFVSAKPRIVTANRYILYRRINI